MNVLITYAMKKEHSFKQFFLNLNSVETKKLIVDSGAFSLIKNHSKRFDFLNIESYMDYCFEIEKLKKKENGIKIEYIAFDYGNQKDKDYIKKSNKNFDIMKERGLNPVPVFRASDHTRTIDKWIEKEPVICIGGLVGMPNNLKTNLFINLKKRYGKKSKRFHLLGMGRLPTLFYFKPRSCDNSFYSSLFKCYKKKYTIMKNPKAVKEILNRKRLLPAYLFDYVSENIKKNGMQPSYGTHPMKILSAFDLIRSVSIWIILESKRIDFYCVMGKHYLGLICYRDCWKFLKKNYTISEIKKISEVTDF